jgi:hypothetical protein
MTAGQAEAEPTVSVECTSLRLAGEPGVWDITWNVQNRGTEPLVIREGWLPHGRFRSPRRSYDPGRQIDPGGEQQFSFAVAVDGPPGAEVENAFVILSGDWRGQPWRIFARVRVPIGEDGTPVPVTESYSVQQIGSAG